MEVEELSRIESLGRAEKNVDVRVQDDIYKLTRRESAQNVNKNAVKIQKDQHYLSECRFSVLALLKIFNHANTPAKQGGKDLGLQQVYGELFGKIENNIFYIMDAIELPVLEIKMKPDLLRDSNNASCEQYADSDLRNYTKDYAAIIEKNSEYTRVGWYRSHLGQGCWLDDQEFFQQEAFQKHDGVFPKVAVVIDPLRSLATGKLELKAFRKGRQLHYNQKFEVYQKYRKEYDLLSQEYYSLKTSFFKSTKDSELIKKLWQEQIWKDFFLRSPIFNSEVQVQQSLLNLADKSDQIRRGLKDKQLNADEIYTGHNPIYSLFKETQLDINKALLQETIKHQLFCFKV